MLTDDYAYYRGKSKDELYRTLLALTEEQKKNGELDAASMEEVYSFLSPFLDDRQRRTLRAVLDNLR